MKIGVDFGTSFSSAAACIEGKVRHITFGHERQFRTAVFFPDRYVDPSQFFLTAENEQEIDNAIRSHKSLYSELVAQYEARLDRLVREEKHSAKDGAPYSAQQKVKRRELLVKPKRLSDEEVRRTTINAIRRRWVSMQRKSIAQEGLDVRQASGVFGEEAIDALYNNELGRIFQSPKSMLGYKLEPRHQDVVVAQVLAHIRTVAGEQLGTEVKAVMLGRPVEFRGVVGSTNDQAAQDLLERAAREAGFSDVEFLMEPSAAAFGYHRESVNSHAALIIDIGGGTTDIAYAQVGGDAHEPVIHKIWGRGRGGTDVDVELSVRTAMPLFGKGHEHGLPLHVYRSAAKVSDLSLQRDFANQSTARVIEPFKARLERLKEKGTTVRLNRDIEQLKIDLSDESIADVPLEYIDHDLSLHADRTDLESSAERFMAGFRDLLEKVRTELPETDPVVFLTGGMSRAPYVQTCVKEVFSQSDIVMGDASLGVVAGLAQFAAPPTNSGSQPFSTLVAAPACAEDKKRVVRQRELFTHGMARADKIADAYEKQREVYQRHYDVQEKIFVGTRIGDYLAVLNENVYNAYELNVQAGWLPSGAKFTELEFFETLIRHDRSGRRYKSLASVPLFLHDEFEGNDDKDFEGYAHELREACRSAYDEMPDLRENMDDEPAEGDFFDALHAWPEEADAPEREIVEGRALFDNLQKGWLGCQKVGLGLLHMANHLGDDDYDPGLMDALLDS